jgi:hypothetical protein
MGLIRIDRDVRRNIAGQGFAWIPRSAWSICPIRDPDETI